MRTFHVHLRLKRAVCNLFDFPNHNFDVRVTAPAKNPSKKNVFVEYRTVRVQQVHRFLAAYNVYPLDAFIRPSGDSEDNRISVLVVFGFYQQIFVPKQQLTSAAQYLDMILAGFSFNAKFFKGKNHTSLILDNPVKPSQTESIPILAMTQPGYFQLNSHEV